MITWIKRHAVTIIGLTGLLGVVSLIPISMIPSWKDAGARDRLMEQHLNICVHSPAVQEELAKGVYYGVGVDYALKRPNEGYRSDVIAGPKSCYLDSPTGFNKYFKFPDPDGAMLK